MIRNHPRVIRRMGSPGEKSFVDVFDSALRQWFSILAETLESSRELKKSKETQQNPQTSDLILEQLNKNFWDTVPSISMFWSSSDDSTGSQVQELPGEGVRVRPSGLQPTRLLCPWDSLSRNTGVGCHALLQGIFQIQGVNPHLLHLSCNCRQVLYHQYHLGSPSITYIYCQNQRKWILTIRVAVHVKGRQGIQGDSWHFLLCVVSLSSVQSLSCVRVFATP